MPATDAPTTTRTTPAPRDQLVCPACPHDPASHDAIGTRFCAATVAGSSNRGCVCVDVATPPADTATP